jgi:hypothetical protein
MKILPAITDLELIAAYVAAYKPIPTVAVEAEG